MANSLRYTFQVIGADSSVITFDDIDAAKDIMDHGDWDFTGLSPVYSLEDSDTTMVITIPFADSEDGRTAQDAFHNNVKDTWDTQVNSPYYEYRDAISDRFIVTSIKDGEVDLNA
jgi:hypothetical protein